MRQAAAVGLVVVVMAGICAGSAAATVLTSPAGTKVGVGAKIKAEPEGTIQWHLGGSTLSCSKSILEAEITNAGGSESSVGASITTLDFSECGNYEVKVVKPGSFQIHTNGAVTWVGGEVTFLRHSELFGTTHCIYYTAPTHIGTLTDSNMTKGTATLDANSSAMPRVTTDTLCAEVASLTSKYKITTPDSLIIEEKEAPGTILTSPKGTKLEVGAEIKAESENAIEFGGSTAISCQKSTLEGKVSKVGGESALASIGLSSFTFSECGNHTVQVVKPGSLEIHGPTDIWGYLSGGGTLISSGAEITVLTHSVFFGTRHCVYTTNNTHIGTLLGSNSGATATLDLGPAATITSPTDGTCGNDAEWGGNYKITSPDYLVVDLIEPA